jgi:hypothetical protein
METVVGKAIPIIIQKKKKKRQKKQGLSHNNNNKKNYIHVANLPLVTLVFPLL